MFITSLLLLMSAISVQPFGLGDATISSFDGVSTSLLNEELSKYNALVYEISHEKYNASDLDDGVTLFESNSLSFDLFITGKYSIDDDAYDINIDYYSYTNTQSINVSGFIEMSYTYEEDGNDFDAKYLIPFTLMDTTQRNLFTLHNSYSFRHDMGDEIDYIIYFWLNNEYEYEFYNSDASYQSGYSKGYIQGYNEGDAEGNADGYSRGYDDGYYVGKTDGITESNDYSFLGLFGAIADTPVMMIRSLFNFDFFGVNLLTIVLSLFTGIILFYLLRKLL